MPEAFHIAMHAAMDGDEHALDPWLKGGAAGRAGLAVYRNTVAKARADALAALYPTVARLVGTDWFRDAALIFARQDPPSGPVMDDYGHGFPDWLESFPPATELAFLAPVARLDRAWSEVHRAAGAQVLSPLDVSALSPAALFGARAVLHPAVRLFWFDWTVPSIWSANRPGTDPDRTVIWDASPEGLLLARPRDVVAHHALSEPQWRFLDACRRGVPLGRAAAALRLDHPALDLSRLFAGLLGLGVFTRLET